METKKFEINGSQSSIEWTGRKVTGAHNGTIAIKSGTLVLSDNKLEFGKFIIDTTSIKVLDVTDAETNAQFSQHLASEDFFASAKFPEATFIIGSATPNGDSTYHIEGNLTIKDITDSVSFDAKINAGEDSLTAKGKVVVDRTKYNMKFRSGNFFKDLGDTLIYNDFNLNVNITAKAA